MAFSTSISAAQYSGLAVSKGGAPATYDQSGFTARFPITANAFLEIKNIRDLPAVGTPANIVKVPVYGSAQTQSIGAQSDAPDLEVTVNYVAGDWAKAGVAFTGATSTLGDAVADGISKPFQLSMSTAKPTSLVATAGGLGTAPNAIIYFMGKIESLMVQPARDDAVTATVALSIQSDFYGPYTV